MRMRSVAIGSRAARMGAASRSMLEAVEGGGEGLLRMGMGKKSTAGTGLTRLARRGVRGGGGGACARLTGRWAPRRGRGRGTAGAAQLAAAWMLQALAAAPMALRSEEGIAPVVRAAMGLRRLCDKSLLHGATARARCGPNQAHLSWREASQVVRRQSFCCCCPDNAICIPGHVGGLSCPAVTHTLLSCGLGLDPECGLKLKLVRRALGVHWCGRIAHLGELARRRGLEGITPRCAT